MKSFVTHLAAGLLGGLIGVIALAFAWHLIPAGKERIRGRARQAQRAHRQARSGAGACTGHRSAGQARRPDQGAREARRPPDIAGLTDRVAQLEQSLKALASAAKDGGSVTDAAAINQQITEAEQRIQENLDKALADAEAANATTLQTMQASIDELKTKIAALAEAGTGGSPRPHRSHRARRQARDGDRQGHGRLEIGGRGDRLCQSQQRRGGRPPFRRRARHDQIVRPRPGRSRTAAGLRRKGHRDGARAYALLRREPGCRACRRCSGSVRLAHRPSARQRLDAGQGQARR